MCDLWFFLCFRSVWLVLFTDLRAFTHGHFCTMQQNFPCLSHISRRLSPDFLPKTQRETSQGAQWIHVHEDKERRRKQTRRFMPGEKAQIFCLGARTDAFLLPTLTERQQFIFCRLFCPDLALIIVAFCSTFFTTPECFLQETSHLMSPARGI